jgi:hypothetical protein
MLRFGLRHLAGAAVLGALAGCSSSTQSTATPTPRPLLQATVTLLHVPAGFATLRWAPSTGRLDLDLSMYGLDRATHHAVELRSGPCPAAGTHSGNRVASLPDVVADGTGAVRTTLSADLADLPAASHLDVLANAAPGGDVLACAQLAGSGSTAPLQKRDAGGRAVTGSAVVALYGPGKIRIHLTARGLAPTSRHAVHIELGTCESRSAQAASFGDATADAAGRVDATLEADSGRLDLRAVAWDVVVALGGGSSQPQPELCGDHVR